MTPTTDERLASIIRSLTEVVLPHLPAHASLAQEQVHLAIGHLRILRLQLDDVIAFESEELADLQALGGELASTISGGRETAGCLAGLTAALDQENRDTRAALSTLNRAIERLVQAVSTDGSSNARADLSQIILRHERVRVEKDRRWFLPYGFDTMETAQ